MTASGEGIGTTAHLEVGLLLGGVVAQRDDGALLDGAARQRAARRLQIKSAERRSFDDASQSLVESESGQLTTVHAEAKRGERGENAFQKCPR